jgi:hypothetical protein
VVGKYTKIYGKIWGAKIGKFSKRKIYRNIFGVQNEKI